MYIWTYTLIIAVPQCSNFTIYKNSVFFELSLVKDVSLYAKSDSF